MRKNANCLSSAADTFRSRDLVTAPSASLYFKLWRRMEDMYVIDVIPFSRTAPGVLTYRSKQDLPVGTIVSITVRRTPTQGIVIDSMPVTAAKEMLKNARFLLSRSAPSASGTLPAALMRAVERTAEQHATTSGAVLATMFGEHIRAGIELPAAPLANGNGYEQALCELPLRDRAAQYKKDIRKCLTAGKTVLLITPTIPELAFWKEELSQCKPLILSGALTGPRRSKALNGAATHAGLIIATPSFAWTPIEKLGIIIIDRVSAGTYVLPKRPYLSIPYAVDALARERKMPLIIGDFPLPLEYRSGDTVSPSIDFAPVIVHDARRPKDEIQADAEPWAAIPKAVMEQIRTEIEDGGRAIVLAARKGYAPAVVCRDCGQAQTDERGHAYSFSMTGGERVFRTSDGNTIDAKRACQRCGSWNLLPLGVGIERVEEELSAALPDATIIMAAPELLMSARKARTAVQEAQRSGTILVGTEAVLPWLYAGQQPETPLPLGVIASADSLLSQPFWRSRERFVRLSYFLNGLCREVILVTRHPDDSAVDAAAHPDSPRFWQEERALRKVLSYPPFGTIITLAIEGSQTRSSFAAKEIQERLAAYSSTQLPSRSLQGSIWRTTLALHLPEDAWPNPELSTYIRSLPPPVRVRIDPESIW